MPMPESWTVLQASARGPAKAGKGEGAESKFGANKAGNPPGAGNVQRVVRLVGGDADAHLRLRLELALVLEALVADLVECVRRIRDQLAQEHLLVAVEGVDDEREELVDLSLEGKCLCFAVA
jgi:hypothetical protein